MHCWLILGKSTQNSRKHNVNLTIILRIDAVLHVGLEYNLRP